MKRRTDGCAIAMPAYPDAMRTALDAPTDALDEQERNFVAQIREHGWFRTSVFAEGDKPGFSYATGFTVNAGAPELIMFSLKDETAHDIFWELFRHAQAGGRLPLAIPTPDVFGGGVLAYAFPVAKRHYRDHLGWSIWFYGGSDFDCWQIVWPDRAGMFPWEVGAEPAFEMNQPDLTDGGWAAALAGLTN